MPIERTANYDLANSLLTQINVELAQSGRQNLMSDHVHAEEIFAGILNLAFGYSLVNANQAKHNAPGIDLVDEGARIVVQVTADWSSEKMKRTLESSSLRKYAEDGYTIKFCYIGEQKACTKRRNPKNPYGIRFNAKEDVILTDDVLKEFLHKSVDEQESIIGLLKKETGSSCLLTSVLLRERMEAAILDLGPRYTPEVNVETPEMAALGALAGSVAFMREFESCCHSLQSSIKRFKTSESSSEPPCKAAIKAIEPLESAICSPHDRRNAAEWSPWATRVSQAAHDCPTFPSAFFDDDGNIDKAAQEYDGVRHFHRELRMLCDKYRCDLLKDGVALLVGDAGTGKSHMLADIGTRCIEAGAAGVLVLGQWFCDPQGSLDVIPSSFGFSDNIDDFLDELSRYSSARARPGIIMVDALNEGAGRAFWRNALPRLVAKAKAHPNLRLIISVRSAYLHEVVPPSLSFLEESAIECSGFRDVSDIAVRAFCERYGIAHPTSPLIGGEFANPLHLKLLCEHLARKGATSFTTSASLRDVMESHLEGINEALSAKLGYDPRVNLTKDVVSALIEHGDFSYGSIDYASAVIVAKRVSEPYVQTPGNFLGELVSGGLFNVFGKHSEERLVFSYELFGNFAMASHIARCAEGLALSSGGALDVKAAVAQLLECDCSWAATDSGVMSALSAISPERLGFELFEAVPASASRLNVVAEAFVKSLGWRSNITMTPDVEAFVMDEVLGYEDTLQMFVDKAFQISIRSNFGMDSRYFQSLVLPLGMPERDYAWSSRIALSSNVLHFAEWAWSHADRFDSGAAGHVARMLALTLCSVNMNQRLTATKALARLMMDKPELAMKIYEEFGELDDDYMLESLHAAIYGGISNSKKQTLSAWAGIADAVCENVFGQAGAYPNIIVRDYSKLIIELADMYGGTKDRPAFKPPYYSDWYDELPSLEEIDRFAEETAEHFSANSDEAIAVQTIISSMTTEYGRGTGMYGDFGRYVFGYAVRDWSNQFDDQLLSNAVTAHILEDWYKPNLHARFDKMLRWYEGRFAPGCERIGKKYQKIGTHRLIARLLDNYPPFVLEYDHRKGYEEALNRSAELRWRAIEEGRFGDLVNGFCEEDWRIGERHVPFGDSQLHRITLSQRDIDPSQIWIERDDGCQTSTFAGILDSSADPEEWVERDVERQVLSTFRIAHDEPSDMYLVAARKHWIHTIDGLKSMRASWITGARIVQPAYIKDLSKGGSEYPSVGDATEHYSDVLFGELYAGYGFTAMDSLCNTERNGENEHGNPVAYEYSWDGELLEIEPRHIFAPSKELADRFCLTRYGMGEWRNQEGNLVATNIFDESGTCSGLLFDKRLMDEYLAETRYEIYWNEYFEKEIRAKLYRCWQFAWNAEGSFKTIVSDQYVVEKDLGHMMPQDDWVD